MAYCHISWEKSVRMKWLGMVSAMPGRWFQTALGISAGSAIGQTPMPVRRLTSAYNFPFTLTWNTVERRSRFFSTMYEARWNCTISGRSQPSSWVSTDATLSGDCGWKRYAGLKSGTFNGVEKATGQSISAGLMRIERPDGRPGVIRSVPSGRPCTRDPLTHHASASPRLDSCQFIWYFAARDASATFNSDCSASVKPASPRRSTGRSALEGWVEREVIVLGPSICRIQAMGTAPLSDRTTWAAPQLRMR